jgi:hypothetical protein
MDRHDRRPAIIRTGHEEQALHLVPVSAERIEVTLQVGLQSVALLGVGFGQLGDLGQRIGPRLEIGPGADLLAELVGAAQQRLRGALVVPEIGIGGLRL